MESLEEAMRGSGRTIEILELVQSEDILIVHNQPMKEYARRFFYDNKFTLKTMPKIIVAKNMRELAEQLRGAKARKVWFDHVFFYRMYEDELKEMERSFNDFKKNVIAAVERPGWKDTREYCS